jgi:hypothetical protein
MGSGLRRATALTRAPAPAPGPPQAMDTLQQRVASTEERLARLEAPGSARGGGGGGGGSRPLYNGAGGGF